MGGDYAGEKVRWEGSHAFLDQRLEACLDPISAQNKVLLPSFFRRRQLFFFFFFLLVLFFIFSFLIIKL